jgi:3-phenylpropionate/trans-cinnamate dioxygenase ferredoxin reductase subunit
VFSELKLEVEPLPPVIRVNASIVHLEEVAPDIVEVTMKPAQALEMLPGQYCRFRFRGFAARAFSPTAALNQTGDDGMLRLNVKRVRDGRVTPQLGKAIKVGHAVTIEGPFGHAFLRPGGQGRLVLVGSGTGFAPVWAVAAAALRENAMRRIVLLAGSRKLATLYMAPALDLVSRFANVKVAACVEDLKRNEGLLLAGDTIGHLPVLTNDDIVYAAGGPKLVDAVGHAAQASGALFYADPFEPEVRPSNSGWLDNAKAWLRAG